MCRFSEAWSALGAENLLTFGTGEARGRCQVRSLGGLPALPACLSEPTRAPVCYILLHRLFRVSLKLRSEPCSTKLAIRM